MENYHEMRFTFTNTAAAVVRRSRPVKAADNMKFRIVLIPPFPLELLAGAWQVWGVWGPGEWRSSGCEKAGQGLGKEVTSWEAGSETSDIPAFRPQSYPLRKVRTLLWEEKEAGTVEAGMAEELE